MGVINLTLIFFVLKKKFYVKKKEIMSIKNKELKKVEQNEIGIYLKAINLDNPNTNVSQKAQLISDTFDVECNVEDINEYYQLMEAYEPDYEWLNDIARAR
jgi:hypothetical protein